MVVMLFCFIVIILQNPIFIRVRILSGITVPKVYYVFVDLKLKLTSRPSLVRGLLDPREQQDILTKIGSHISMEFIMEFLYKMQIL